VLSAFALSWVVGFLVFPLPSGIGVREAVLLAVVPGASSAALLGASLAQRFLVLGSEVAATVGNQVLARRERRARAASGAAAVSTAADETPDHPGGAPGHDVQGEDATPAGNVRASPAGETR
jgi:glycosyltransferase 2 family protein